MKNRVLLKDIAKHMNLTTNTVSRALNDRDDISAKTKEDVRRVAEELGYIPDIIASSMRTATTRTIAVLFDNLLNPYFMIMADAINSHLIDKGYDMMIFTTTRSEAILTMDVFKQMVSRRVDGVITFLRPSEDVARMANKIHLPMFIVGREGDDLGIDSIYTDDIQGGRLMGEYLKTKGCANIGYLGGPKDIMCNVKRAEGIEGYCLDKNIPVRALYAEWDDASVFRNADALIASGVDAIFCFNDSIAYALKLHIAKHHPTKGDIIVTGYDNIAGQLELPIPMTTVGCDIEGMVTKCVDRLMDKIDDFDLPLYVEVVPTFLVRHDT